MYEVRISNMDPRGGRGALLATVDSIEAGIEFLREATRLGGFDYFFWEKDADHDAADAFAACTGTAASNVYTIERRA